MNKNQKVTMRIRKKLPVLDGLDLFAFFLKEITSLPGTTGLNLSLTHEELHKITQAGVLWCRPLKKGDSAVIGGDDPTRVGVILRAKVTECGRFNTEVVLKFSDGEIVKRRNAERYYNGVSALVPSKRKEQLKAQGR